jgi:hypothetical protein
MRGEISSGRKAKRHPLDWCVEQGWEWQQVVEAIGLEEQDDAVAIWDPAAGYGRSGANLQALGFTGRIFLSDLVRNVDLGEFEEPEHVQFFSADFLEVEKVPSAPCSLFSNPPYSYKRVWYDGRKVSISEAFIRHALKLVTHRVVMLLPNKWLSAGKNRSRLMRIDAPPQLVLHFTKRPSMPPGDRIAAMGTRAHKGGMIDYCAVVWDVRYPTTPGNTRTIWLPPTLYGEAAI